MNRPPFVGGILARAKLRPIVEEARFVIPSNRHLCTSWLQFSVNRGDEILWLGRVWIGTQKSAAHAQVENNRRLFPQIAWQQRTRARCHSLQVTLDGGGFFNGF